MALYLAHTIYSVKTKFTTINHKGKLIKSGLGEEVTKICDEIGIADVNNEAVPTKVIK